MPLKIDPTTYYSPHDPEMRAIKTVASLAQDRTLGRGLPFKKIGRKVFYKGADILAVLEQ